MEVVTMERVFWIQTPDELNDLNDFLRENNGKVKTISATSYGVRGYDGADWDVSAHKTYSDTSAFVVVVF